MKSSTAKKKSTTVKTRKVVSSKVSKRAAKPRVSGKATDPNDIVSLILKDHKPLKSLIKVLKEPEKGMGERRKAFEEFAPLLVAHAKPEEAALYSHMKRDDDLREEAFEGDAEHALADQLLEDLKTITDPDLWSAKVKVLAELVEHHIEEEEEEMLPDFQKQVSIEDRIGIGQKYLALKPQFEAGDSPAQSDAKPFKDASGYRMRLAGRQS